MGLTPENHIFPLIPKWYLGTKMVAKLSLASKGVPKLELGNEKKAKLGNEITRRDALRFPALRLRADP
jgi:hypothetical protein